MDKLCFCGNLDDFLDIFRDVVDFIDCVDSVAWLQHWWWQVRLIDTENRIV